MRKPWTIRRVLLLALGALLGGIGINLLISASRLEKQFHAWQTARPVDAVVDLSVPGRYAFDFNQTCSSAHGEIINLQLPTEVLQANSVTQLLAGLDARLAIYVGATTQLVANAQADWIQDRYGTNHDGLLPVFRMSSFPKGHYKGELFVVLEAPKLSGVSQRLVGRYELCGLELFPAKIGQVVGIMSLGIAALICLPVCVRMYKDGKAASGHLNQSV